jgi:signal transduction histidine kinase
MGEERPLEPGARMAKLLRHLSEAALRDADARGRLAAGLARLLAAPVGGEAGLEALVQVAAEVIAPLDAAGVLARRGERLEVVAAVGLAQAPAGVGAEDAGPVAQALRTGEPVLSSGGPAPLPPGTLAAYAVPLLGARGDALGVACFASRSAQELTEEERLLALVACERAARWLERARLEAELAREHDLAAHTAFFRDQVLAIVGHDLRNPLGAIVMSAALLQRRGGLTGWQGRTVDRVRASAARMGRIINDLLSYTRTRLGGGIPIARRSCDLAQVASKVVEELRAAHPEATVDVAVAGELGGDWDPDRLEQVVSNLVSNAIDHGEEGQAVKVELRRDAEGVALEVRNRGEMPPAVLEHAFEAFHRAPEGTGKKASGLGLGLYIAREIVRRHGGEITVDSASGETRISMRLPLVASQPDAVGGSGAKPPSP